MARRGLLIVSADDFGHDMVATDRTLECFRDGRITSTSAMVFMEDSERASGLAREAGLPVGLHINLSEAFTDPGTPSPVTTRQARLVRRFGVDQRRRLMRWLYDPTIQAEVDACIADQLARFRQLYGTEPTHVDGHQHVHLCPNVFLAHSLHDGIRMRTALEKYPLRHSPLAVARAARHRLIARRFASPQHLFDIGEVDPRADVEARQGLLRLADGQTVEVMAHPGFGHELDPLMSGEWAETLRERPLGSFADLDRHPTRMRVLAITNEFPLPLDRGGPVRFFGLARALAQNHDVHLLALRRPSTTAELQRRLQAELGGPVEVFEPDPVRDAKAVRWARAIRQGVPPWITAQHSSHLEHRALELVPDVDVVVILDDYAAIYAAPLAAFAPVVCDKSNVMGASAVLAPRGHGLRARVRRPLAIHLSRRFEKKALSQATSVVSTSQDESNRLERLYGRAADAVVPSAVDVPAAPTEPNGARTVGWLGTHEYSANVEGLVRFVKEGWKPLGEDGFRLLVAGGGAPPEVDELAGHPGVEILGFVESLDEFFAGLGAAVVPLWRGAGVKLKTLSFMSAGVPVVGTPVAVEGLQVQHGRHCLVADDPAELAACVRELVADVDAARRIGAEGRRLVEAGYTWPAVGASFSDAVAQAVSGASAALA